MRRARWRSGPQARRRASDLRADHRARRVRALGRSGQSSTPGDLRAALFAPQPALFGHVAAAGEQMIGFALWFLNYSTWSGKHGIYLEDLYVRPEHARPAAPARRCSPSSRRSACGAATAGWSGGYSTGTHPAIGFYESLGADGDVGVDRAPADRRSRSLTWLAPWHARSSPWRRCHDEACGSPR